MWLSRYWHIRHNTKRDGHQLDYNRLWLLAHGFAFRYISCPRLLAADFAISAEELALVPRFLYVGRAHHSKRSCCVRRRAPLRSRSVLSQGESAAKTSCIRPSTARRVANGHKKAPPELNLVGLFVACLPRLNHVEASTLQYRFPSLSVQGESHMAVTVQPWQFAYLPESIRYHTLLTQA